MDAPQPGAVTTARAPSIPTTAVELRMATTGPPAHVHRPGRRAPRPRHQTASASAPRRPRMAEAAAVTHPPGAQGPRHRGTESRRRHRARRIHGLRATHLVRSMRLPPARGLVRRHQAQPSTRLRPVRIMRLLLAPSTLPLLGRGRVVGAQIVHRRLARLRRLHLVREVATIRRLRLVVMELLKRLLPLGRGILTMIE